MLPEVLLWMLFAAGLVPAHQAAFRRGDSTLAGLLCADVVALSLVAVAASSESRWQSLAQEDGLVEWGTTFAFVCAAALNARAIRREITFANLVRVALVLFCIFVAGEEISWGQRLVGFQPPELFLEKNFQQELNLHNVLMDESVSGLGFEVESKHMVALIAIVFGVVGPLLVGIRPFRSLAPIAPPFALAPLFVGVAVAELAYPVDLTGEGAEMMLGVLFAIAAAVDAGPRRVVVAAVVPLVLAAITAPLIARVIYGSDEEGTAACVSELEVLGGDLVRGAQPKLFGKQSIHKRLYTATRDRYFALESAAYLSLDGATDDRERRKWFLDPWQNPYWVVVEKKSNRALVYSFGPNRRRDTNVRERDTAEGDDIVRMITLDR